MESRHNYIRSNRRQTGLSQRDIAYLLGNDHSMNVSRYERNERLPRIDTVLALQIVLGVSSSELFPDLYQRVEKTIIHRAQELLKKIGGEQNAAAVHRKVNALKSLLTRDSSGPSNA